MGINNNYDVVIFGAGPFGIATAYELALINKDARIAVFDTRDETRRHYALHIDHDAMQAINRVLKEHLSDPLARQEEIKEAMQFFNGWAGRSQKTKDIEDSLAERAKNIGVRVFRNKEYETEITETNFPNLFEEEIKSDKELTPAQKDLRTHVAAARVLIGGDGRHSATRKAILGNDEEVLEEHELLSYFLEIKYETNPQVQRRGYTSVKTSSFDEGVNFETVAKGRATNHFDISQEAYEHLAEATDKTPWSLATFREKAANDPILANELDRVEHYIAGVVDRRGSCIDEKIKRLPVEIYLSSNAVALYKGKVVAWGGDAHAGAVFARGVNKAFLDAAELAKTTNDYLRRNAPFVPDTIPEEYQRYQTAVRATFAKEAYWARLKATAIKTASYVLGLLAVPVIWIRNCLAFIYYSVSSRIMPRRVVQNHPVEQIN